MKGNGLLIVSRVTGLLLITTACGAEPGAPDVSKQPTTEPTYGAVQASPTAARTPLPTHTPLSKSDTPVIPTDTRPGPTCTPVPSTSTPTAPAQADPDLWEFAIRLDQALTSKEVEFFITTAMTEEFPCGAFMEMPDECEQDLEREAPGIAIGGGTGAAFILSLEDYGDELRSMFEAAPDQARDEIGSGRLQLYGIQHHEQHPDHAVLVCTYIDESGRRLIVNFPAERREQQWWAGGFSVWHDVLEQVRRWRL